MTFSIQLRRLHRSQLSKIFLSQIINPPQSSSLFVFRHHNFSAAFPQTVTSPCNGTSQNLHFSTATSSHFQKRYEITDYSQYLTQSRENAELAVEELAGLTRKAAELRSGDEALDFLDQGGVKPSKNLIFLTVLSLREEWKLAFLVFKWGEKWDSVDEKCWCLMIWVLGNRRKFGTAWSLIHDLQTASKDSKQAILTIIDRYVAANSVDKAMRTFKIMEKVRLTPDREAFFTFLSILCKHGNVEEAEEFMFLNKRFFPLETEGFNIILNGWCDVAADIFEAKRVWREMSKCCILPDGTSYTHLISCFSKSGNLFDSLRLYDEMKKKGFVPGIEVYNSLARVLASQNCLKDSLAIIDKIKEAGLSPDSTTYDSIIAPLCEGSKREEARIVLAMMIEDNVSPTIDTYHAFLSGVSLEEAFEVFQHMKKSGLGPGKKTFSHVMSNFFELTQPESALKVWLEMQQYGIEPDSTHYTILVEGLAKCGSLVKAREFLDEMRCKGFGNDPKLEKLLKKPVSSTEGDHSSIVKYDEEDDSLPYKERRNFVGFRRHEKSKDAPKTGCSNSTFSMKSKR